MFGPIANDGASLGWHRLARRRVRGYGSYGDADWGALATAAAGLIAGVTTAVVKATQPNTQTQYPGSYQTGSPFYVNPCPAGYQMVNGQCMNSQGAQPGAIDIGFGPMEPTTLLAIGAVGLALILGRD